MRKPEAMPLRFSFDIPGNQDDERGNPIPKLKMTGRQHWTPRARRYVAWKAHVQDALLHSLPKPARAVAERNIALCGKPLAVPGEKGIMAIRIWWKDGRRPDAENVFGSIADALFVNDRNLAGSFDFEPKPTGSGLVSVYLDL